MSPTAIHPESAAGEACITFETLTPLREEVARSRPTELPTRDGFLLNLQAPRIELAAELAAFAILSRIARMPFILPKSGYCDVLRKGADMGARMVGAT